MSGGGGAPQMMFLPSQQTTTNQIPQWVQDAGKANYDSAVNMNPAAFAAYTGPRVAGMNPYQLGAINALQSNVGETNAGYQNAMNAGNSAVNQAGSNYSNAGNSASGVGSSINGLNSLAGTNPAQQAMDWLQSATRYKPDNVKSQSMLEGNLNAYMNPYTESVINSSLSTLDRQKQNALNSVADNARTAGAFGGSRFAIQDALTDSEYGRQAGDLAANLRNQNYNQAVSALQNDQAKNLQAQLANQSAGMQNLGLGINAASNAGQMGLSNKNMNMDALQSAGALGINQGNLYNSIATNQGNLGLQNAQLQGQLTGQQQSDYLNSLNAALQGGGMMQNQNQNEINAQMQQYADQQNSYLAPLNLRMQALGMTPYNTSSSTSGFSSQMYQPTSSSPLASILGLGLGLTGMGRNLGFGWGGNKQ